jgi:hypothetical protein
LKSMENSTKYSSSKFIKKNYSEIPSWFHFYSWEINCSKTVNFYWEFCE